MRDCTATSDCGEGCACDKETQTCRRIECQRDSDCVSRYGVGFHCASADQLCYGLECTGKNDCSECQECIQGHCRSAQANCPDADTIRILEGNGFIREGESVSLSAFVLSGEQNVVLTGDAAIFWESSDPETVSVNVATGTLTGGTANGTATITASLTCACPSLATSVTYQNFPTIADGSARVVVFDETTGELLDGVKVYLGAHGPTDTVEGRATFADVDCSAGCDLHVFKEGFSYLSAFGLKSVDIKIPLEPNRDKSVSAGAKGFQDASLVPNEEELSVYLGFTGFSYTGKISDLNFQDYLGTMFKTRLSFPPIMDGDYYVSSGLEMNVGDKPVKNGFMASTSPGVNTLWGLGGFSDYASLLAGLSSDGIAWGALLASLMPFIENFYHGINPNLTVNAIPNIPDENDINGNQNTDELVPDFQAMPETDMPLLVAQDQITKLTFGQLPAYPTSPSGCADSILTMPTAMQKGVGLIPYGINAALDMRTDDDTPDCRVGADNEGSVQVRYAPQYGVVQGTDYKFVSFATVIEELFSLRPVTDVSGVVGHAPMGTEGLVMPEFLGIMTDTDYDSMSGQLQATPVSGATFHKATLIVRDDTLHEMRYWKIYWGHDVGQIQLQGIIPNGMEDRSSELDSLSMIQAIRLEQVGYDALFEFNGTNLDRINELVTGYSIHGLRERTW